MNATSPLWLTVLLAVLAPVLTLAGVWITQRASDKRAVREAELRLEQQRDAAQSERQYTLYQDLLAACSSVRDYLMTENSAWNDPGQLLNDKAFMGQFLLISEQLRTAVTAAEIAAPKPILLSAQLLRFSLLGLFVDVANDEEPELGKRMELIMKAMAKLRREIRFELTGLDDLDDVHQYDF